MLHFINYIILASEKLWRYLQGEIWRKFYRPRVIIHLEVLPFYVSEGEEIYVSYNYTVATAPEWYQQSWLSYLR